LSDGSESRSTGVIPIVLFAYARPVHLQKTLDALRQNQVPLIYAFSDGPRTADKAPAVAEVRAILRAIDWCRVILCERSENLGLGTSIVGGVTEVLSKETACIVFEDDLACVPGTYQYLCTALEHYEQDSRVMSVSGWTHPLITPTDVGDQPYFDGRPECWVWGTWQRSWQGMPDTTALELLQQCERRGIDPYRYGADLVKMAHQEQQRNIWAVRWSYHHIVQRGLCVRPPWSMVDHIGFDNMATNTLSADAEKWKNPTLRPAPPLPTRWPEPVENAQVIPLYHDALGKPPVRGKRAMLRERLSKIKRLIFQLGR
jgi:hypothetical protein